MVFIPLSKLNQSEVIAALSSLTDNFYCEQNINLHTNQYYGLFNEEIDAAYGNGFSKLTRDEKAQAIKFLASNLV